MSKGLKIKITVILSVLVMFLSLLGIDALIASTYKIETEDLSALTIVADGEQIVSVKIRLTKRGKAVEGHEIFAMAYGGGGFIRPRLVTNEEGIAVFQYRTYRSTRFTPAGEVRFEFKDYSNSVFIRVSAAGEQTIVLIEP